MTMILAFWPSLRLDEAITAAQQRCPRCRGNLRIEQDSLDGAYDVVCLQCGRRVDPSQPDRQKPLDWTQERTLRGA